MLTPSSSSAGPIAPQAATLACRCEKRIPISSLPYLISTSGSYYVTRDLVGVSGYGIGIAADDVTLDLNGYTVRGSGGSEGIVVFSAQENVTIENGVVRGWSGIGINAGNVTNGRLERLCADSNGGSGIAGGFDCQILECSASSNGQVGILARSGSIVEKCSARSNVIGFAGTAPAHGMSIRDCTASSNTDDGIFLSGSVGCTLSENTCHGNTDRGIHILSGNGNRVDSNQCAANAVGIEIGTSGTQNNVLVRNSCRMNTSANYAFGAGTDAGPVGAAATATSPWANL